MTKDNVTSDANGSGKSEAEIFGDYSDRLRQHIELVRAAGARLGVPAKQLATHDASKWSKEEFGPYARKFCGDGGDPHEFAVAWLHHIHHNPHHWQHWIFPDGYSPPGALIENGVVRMPYVYALEMIADWMGASKAYTGSWDMTKWLWENMPKIRLHSETAAWVRNELDMLGYADTVYVQQFAHED